MVVTEDQFIIAGIKSGDQKIFERFFKEMFDPLYRYAYSMVREELSAKDIIQQVFCKIWENRLHLSIDISLQAYVYRAVYNTGLNHIKKQSKDSTYSLSVIDTSRLIYEERSSLENKELEKQIYMALNELPEACRTIFHLSRYEDLKNREIAEKLGISIKTVEGQITKALKTLRSKLIAVLPKQLL